MKLFLKTLQSVQYPPHLNLEGSQMIALRINLLFHPAVINVPQIHHTPPTTNPPTPTPRAANPTPLSLTSIWFSIQNKPFRFPYLRTPSPFLRFTETPLPRTAFPFPCLWTTSPSTLFTEAPLSWTPFPFPELWRTLPSTSFTEAPLSWTPFPFPELWRTSPFPQLTFCEFHKCIQRPWKEDPVSGVTQLLVLVWGAERGGGWIMNHEFWWLADLGGGRVV